MKYKIYFQIFTLIMVISVASCVEVDENYSQYLDEGEILYTTKADSLYVFAGNHRVQLQPFVTNAFSVTEFIVYWNNGENSQVFPFTKTDGNNVDSPKLIVTGLEEKTYAFEVYSRDAEGNRSVIKNTYATAYGELFTENLYPRAIISFKFDGLTGAIHWLTSDESERGTQVIYTDTSGTEITLNVPSEETETFLPNLDPDVSVRYSSNYVPTPFDEDRQIETSIDTFTSFEGELIIPELFKSILSTVEITPIIDGVLINLTNSNNDLVNITIEYIIGGEAKSLEIRTSDTDISLSIAGLDVGVQDITIFVGDDSGNNFGGIYSIEPKTIIPFDTSLIEIINLPTDAIGAAYGGTFYNLFDGNINNYYHTNNKGTDLLQHHFTMDLKSEVVLTKFSITPRQACCRDRSPNHFQLWGRLDLNGDYTTALPSGDAGWDTEMESKGWILITDERPDESWNGSKTDWDTYIDPHTPIRYLRFRFMSSYGTHTQTALAEFKFWE